MEQNRDTIKKDISISSDAQSWSLCNIMGCRTPGLPVHHWLPEFTQTYVHQVGDAIQPPHPLSSPSPPAFDVSQNQCLFQWFSSSHQVAKVLEFQLHISPSNEYSRLISFRIDWQDLLAVQGTLKSLLQYHSSKASILWPPDVKNWLIWKDPDAGKDWRWEKGTTEDEMVGWHYQLHGHEFKQAPGVGDG